MENFAREQERMRDYFLGAMGTNTALKPLEEMARQNVEIFDQMMKMFSPFGEAANAVNESAPLSADDRRDGKPGCRHRRRRGPECPARAGGDVRLAHRG